MREGAAPRPLPEPHEPADVAAAPPRRRHVRGDRLGHRDPRDRASASRRFATPTAASRSSTTAAAGRGTTSAARYSGATLRALGARYRANALSQEKTGEFWVNGKMFGGAMIRGDFEHCRGRAVRRQEPVAEPRLPAGPDRRSRRSPTIRVAAIIVIDPKRSETAELADFHLQVRPGTDAFCLAALVAVLVQERLTASELARRAQATGSTRSSVRSRTCRSPSTPRGAASPRS